MNKKGAVIFGFLGAWGGYAAANGGGAAPAQTVAFDVWEIRVEGNSLLPATDIERMLYPHLGASKRIDDVETARQALEQRYRDAGYPAVLVDLPEQDVSAGVVRLRVNEGYIDNLRITGARYFSIERLRARVPALTEGNTLQLSAAQAQLGAFNGASADRAVTPVLRPGKTPGTVEVELKVEDQLPLHGAVELNDRYSTDTSKLRLNASLSYDNLWQREHGLSLAYQTAPEDTDEVRVWSGTYVARLPQAGAVITAYAVNSRSNTAAVGALAVTGRGDIGGLRAIIPVQADPACSSSVSLGLDYKNFKESVTLQGADALNTPIDYYVFSAQFSGGNKGDARAARYGVGVNFGVRGLDRDRVDCLGQSLDEFECKRHGARSNFAVLRANADWTREIFSGWHAFAKLEGQAADSPLISNEQFSAGGAESVRGYTESQQLGDAALVGAFELRWTRLAARWPDHVQELYLAAFAEGAALRVNDPLPEQESSHELSSAGVAARLSARNAWHVALDWARVLKPSGAVDAGDTRVHFSIEYTF
jgi:hemolysin activation/secretion protein